MSINQDNSQFNDANRENITLNGFYKLFDETVFSESDKTCKSVDTYFRTFACVWHTVLKLT